MTYNDDDLREFKQEANDLLDQAEKALLAVDRGGSFSEQYDVIFRVLHTIKGASGMVEMNDVQSHFHQVENALVKLGKDAHPTHEQIDFFCGHVMPPAFCFWVRR
jgi:two-component system chemotaxis sensor kinase CheA